MKLEQFKSLCFEHFCILRKYFSIKSAESENDNEILYHKLLKNDIWTANAMILTILKPNLHHLGNPRFNKSVQTIKNVIKTLII